MPTETKFLVLTPRIEGRAPSVWVSFWAWLGVGVFVALAISGGALALLSCADRRQIQFSRLPGTEVPAAEAAGAGRDLDGIGGHL